MELSPLIAAVAEFVRVYMEQYQDCSHDWLHVERVCRLALRLAELEGAMHPEYEFDREVVQLGAMLHDVGDFKYVKDGKTGPQIIEELLGSHGCPRDRIAGVLEIVAHVSYRHELEHGCPADRIRFWREFTVVQDADRLDAIGAIGVARCLAYSGRKNTPFYIPSLASMHGMTADDYNRQTRANSGSARAHFDEKLVKLKGLLKSEAGRGEAERRHEFMCLWMQQFDLDCGLGAA